MRSRLRFFIGQRPLLLVAGFVLTLAGRFAATAAAEPAAGGRHEEVVVVYNSNLPDSRGVAAYYAERRQIPENRVWGFDLPTAEAISRADFLERLQQPLLAKLEAEKLFTFTNAAGSGRVLADARIRYLALCYGVPIKVENDPTLVEPEAEALQPELKRNNASVDSELACLPVLAQKFLWTGPRLNPLYAATNASVLHPTNGILLVSRLDGPSPAIARGLVDKALQAERDGLWGRAFFDVGWSSGNEAYQIGDGWLWGAADLCRRLGFETVLDTNKGTFAASFPLAQTAVYAGWYAGSPTGPFIWNGVEFMPGAFAYHLHSFSASTLRSSNQNWVGPLLAQGATATMGSVYEPYLAVTPDLNVFFWRFTYFGFTFAEAAWACQKAVSWQNLAVGDPLYQPFAQRPEERIPELEKRASPLLEWYLLMRANVTLAGGGGYVAAINLLKDFALTRASAILQEKMGDLYWENKRLSDALAAYAQALRLKPSRLQRLGLLLKTGERLTAYGRKPQALEAYEELLREYPEYPERLAVCQQILPLARQLEKQEVVARCEAEIKRLSPAPEAP